MTGAGVRVAVVGAGIAGAALAWRLGQAGARAMVDVYAATAPRHGDATGVSGGMVRGFEIEPGAAGVAAASLAELRASARLRAWAGYREIGSVYVLAPGTSPERSLAVVNEVLPGSGSVLTGRALAARFRDLPDGAVGVVERHAGYLSPAALRSAVLAHLVDTGTTLRAGLVASVTPAAEVRLADGTVRGYDVAVVAAGAWTPSLLDRSGLPGHGLCTKQIQYSVFAGRLPGLGAFVDDTTGLYGRPLDDGSVLLGLPCDRWGVDPARVAPDTALVGRVAAVTEARLGVPVAGDHPLRTVASFDCFHPAPGLALRPVTPGGPVFSFTAGSGGAAKAVVAASRTAARQLLDGGPS